MRSFKRIAIHHPAGIAIWESILKGVFQFARPDVPWLLATSLDSDLERIRSWSPDAAIVQCTNDHEVEFFRELAIPIVNVARESSEISFPSVQIDDLEVGRMAATYFLDRGLQSLGCFSIANRDFMNARLDGFCGTARKSNVAPLCYVAEQFAHGQYLSTPDEQLLAWLLSLPKPCGVLATTDALGVALLSACRMAELRVPEDLSIIGVSNNELLCHLEYPSLSSIRLPGEKLGFEAANQLHSILAGKKVENSVTRLSPIEVVNRQSSDIYCIDDEHLKKALEFIKDNFQTPINVSSVEKQVEISRSGLERRFRKLLGRSILDELMAQRVKAAKRLLVTSELQIQSIAEQTGFTNARQFATAFRKQTGETPGSYRERLSH